MLGYRLNSLLCDRNRLRPPCKWDLCINKRQVAVHVCHYQVMVVVLFNSLKLCQ